MPNPILGGGGTAHRRMSEDSDRQLEGSKCCWGLCCGPGLAIGVVACIYFIIILPAGLFLAMVGGPKSTVLLLVGLAFVFIPLIIFSVGCFCYRRRKRRRHDGYHTPSANFVQPPRMCKKAPCNQCARCGNNLKYGGAFVIPAADLYYEM